jgi:preprotein translocase subunit SecG
LHSYNQDKVIVMAFTFLVVIIIIVCILLSLAVLIQNPKGSGLGAGFANIGNQVMGARRATETIEKATWTLAILLLALTLLSAVFLPKSGEDVSATESSVVEDLSKERPATPPAGFNPVPTEQPADGGMVPATEPEAPATGDEQ